MTKNPFRIKISDTDKLRYDKMFQETRIKLRGKKVFQKTMLKIMRRKFPA